MARTFRDGTLERLAKRPGLRAEWATGFRKTPTIAVLYARLRHHSTRLTRYVNGCKGRTPAGDQ
jgi:hypothetical protein